MNFYPSHLKAIVAYIDALDAAEAEVMKIGDELPYPAQIRLTDSADTDYGMLRDEIGGAWSWFPPERNPYAG